MKKRTIAVLLVFVLIFALLPFSGCSPQQRPGPAEPAPPADMTGYDTEKANGIANKISGMEEVNSATVVLGENAAWVGLDLKAGVSNNLTDKVKNDVTQTVKENAQGVRTVYVTADVDTVTRLRNIARDLATGKPISGFLNELNEMGRRITPSAR